MAAVLSKAKIHVGGKMRYWLLFNFFLCKYNISQRNVGRLVYESQNSDTPSFFLPQAKSLCLLPPKDWFKGSNSSQCGFTWAHWSRQGQEFTAVNLKLITNVFTTFLGNMEDLLSFCATTTGAHQPFHTCPLCLCHRSLALGENEHSKGFPLRYYLSLLLVPAPLFSSHHLSSSHLNSLLSLGGPAL